MRYIQTIQWLRTAWVHTWYHRTTPSTGGYSTSENRAVANYIGGFFIFGDLGDVGVFTFAKRSPQRTALNMKFRLPLRLLAQPS